MAYPFTDNRGVTVTDIIASNLAAWMANTPGLDTIQKVAARSGVGFGTVRRARNGDGNTTVQNLAAIAHAFRRAPEDLLRPAASQAASEQVTAMEPRAPPYSSLAIELATLADEMNDDGKWELIGTAKVLIRLHPKNKTQRA